MLISLTGGDRDVLEKTLLTLVFEYMVQRSRSPKSDPATYRSPLAVRRILIGLPFKDGGLEAPSRCSRDLTTSLFIY